MSEPPASPARLAAVQQRIAAAAQAAKRDPASIHLVAVTKTFGAEDILPVLEAGHRVYRREPRAGGHRQVAGSAPALPGH